MNIRSTTRSAIVAIAIGSVGLGTCLPVPAQIPVTDVAAIANQIQELLYWAQQIQAMETQIANQTQQYDQLVETYNSFNGARNLGQLLSSPADQHLLQYVPPQWRDMIAMASYGANSQYGALASAIQAYLRQNQLYTSQQLGLSENSAAAQQLSAQAQSVATYQGLGQATYETTSQQITQLQTLVHQVDQTTDPKASTDLNARIAAANAQLLAELVRAVAMQQKQAADQQALQLQQQQTLLHLTVYQPQSAQP